ncbi:MAG: penicillin-binding protein 1B [Pseudomonadota bacterium]
MARKKRKARRTRPYSGPGFFRFLLPRLLLACVLIVAGFGAYIDREIRSRFDSNIHAQPATVFARPTELYAGLPLNARSLSNSLVSRGYRSVNQISAPGQVVRKGNLMDVYLRSTVLDTETLPATPVRLEFSENSLQKIISHRDGAALDSVFLDAERIGTLQLGSYEDRISLKLHEMPELLVRALLIMEDRNFETHIGLDFSAIIRALWNNLRSGEALQGGSTLTQQLVKNLFLTPQRTLSRKALEAVMAVVMELRYSKSEILTLYVNEIFLGQSGNRAVHGFALASEFYFGRPLSSLQLHETAMLVGMIPAPSYYNPRRHPERALGRRNLVLKTLSEFDAINALTAANLSEKPLGVIKTRNTESTRFPAYVDYLHRQLRQYFSDDVLRSDGLKLFTSLDLRIQQAAQQSLSTSLAELDASRGLKKGTLQGAAVVVDIANGEILSIVGDRTAGYSGFNRAVDAHRPVGSLIKPFVYLTALEQPRHYSLATVLEDTPLTVEPRNGKPWSPQNYDKDYRGSTMAIDALVHSYNVPTVRLGLQLGVDSVVDTLQRLGSERSIDEYPSTLLGASEHSPLEMAQIYQPVANHGVRVPLRSIRQITTARNKPIARFPVNARRVIKEDSAFLLNYAMQQVVSRGTAARAGAAFSTKLQLAGKTGTTDNYRDSWFAGYSGNILTVVWVGRDDNKPTGLTGSSGALRVWTEIMKTINLEPNHWIDSERIRFLSVDSQTGLRAGGACEAPANIPFVNGYQPTQSAPCAGLIGQVQNWFNIRTIDSVELSAPTSQSVESRNN